MKGGNSDLVRGTSDDLRQTLLHIVRAAFGIGEREHILRLRVGFEEDVRDTECEYLCLACARACDHHHRSVDRIDRTLLLLIKGVVALCKF